MNAKNIARFTVAFATSICVSALLNALAWPLVALPKVFVIYAIVALAFGVWVGLPSYGLLNLYKRANFINTVVGVSIIYGVVYIGAYFMMNSSVELETINNIAKIRNGVPTSYGVHLLLVATFEIVVIGFISYLVFWLLFIRAHQITRVSRSPPSVP